MKMRYKKKYIDLFWWGPYIGTWCDVPCHTWLDAGGISGKQPSVSSWISACLDYYDLLHNILNNRCFIVEVGLLNLKNIGSQVDYFEATGCTWGCYDNLRCSQWLQSGQQIGSHIHNFDFTDSSWGFSENFRYSQRLQSCQHDWKCSRLTCHWWCAVELHWNEVVRAICNLVILAVYMSPGNWGLWLVSWYLINAVQSLQFIWWYGSSTFHLLVPNFLMGCSDFIKW